MNITSISLPAKPPDAWPRIALTPLYSQLFMWNYQKTCRQFIKTAFGKTISKAQALRAGLNLRSFSQDLVFLSVDAGDRWYGWDACFKNLSTFEQRPRRKVEFNSYSLLVNSMLAGHGVGLAWEGLLDSYFETGALVRLSEVQLATNRGYYLFLRDDRKASAKVRKVGEWILSAATAEHSMVV